MHFLLLYMMIAILGEKLMLKVEMAIEKAITRANCL